MATAGWCGMELADHGAEVIKIEVPSTGDPARELLPKKNGESPHHAFRNRGKKSITLNLENEKGREVFRDLVKSADVVLENFTPGTMEAWGLGYESLSKEKPSLVYGRITPYGAEGKEKNMTQNGLVVQAKAGVMYVTGFPEKEPTRIGFSIAERYAASFLSSSVCIALYHARKSGEGQLVETSLTGAVVAVTEDKVITYGVDKEDPMRTGNAHPLINPYDILKCKNGYVAMGISSDYQWGKFCDVFQRPEWVTDEKYCSNLVRGYHYFGDLRNKIEDLFKDYTMQEIAKMCDDALIPGTMCATTKEALEEPQLRERNMVISVDSGKIGSVEMPGRPVKFLGFPEEPIQRAPALGEHNREVYASCGMDDGEIRELEEQGII